MSYYKIGRYRGINSIGEPTGHLTNTTPRSRAWAFSRAAATASIGDVGLRRVTPAPELIGKKCARLAGIMRPRIWHAVPMKRSRASHADRAANRPHNRIFTGPKAAALFIIAACIARARPRFGGDDQCSSEHRRLLAGQMMAYRRRYDAAAAAAIRRRHHFKTSHATMPSPTRGGQASTILYNQLIAAGERTAGAACLLPGRAKIEIGEARSRQHRCAGMPRRGPRRNRYHRRSRASYSVAGRRFASKP